MGREARERGRWPGPGCFAGRRQIAEALDVHGDGRAHMPEVSPRPSPGAAAAHAVSMDELVDGAPTAERTAYRARPLGVCRSARTRTCRSRSSRGGKPMFRAPFREAVCRVRTGQGSGRLPPSWPRRRVTCRRSTSMRQRTASAACRFDRPSRNRGTPTVAGWAGERPGRPSRGYRSVKSSSHHSPSAGLAPPSPSYRPDCSPARPARSGRGPAHRSGDGARNGYLDHGIGLRNSPSTPGDHAAAPGSSKIPDRVELRTPNGMSHLACCVVAGALSGA